MAHTDGVHHLVLSLLYGTGMRLMEGLLINAMVRNLAVRLPLRRLDFIWDERLF